MQKRCGHRSLIEVYGIECLLASQRVLSPAFLEGVRAVLVDKDGKPDWNETLGDTLPEWIDAFFDSLPPVQDLPLHDFGAERLDRRFKSWA